MGNEEILPLAGVHSLSLGKYNNSDTIFVKLVWRTSKGNSLVLANILSGMGKYHFMRASNIVNVIGMALLTLFSSYCDVR